MGGNRARALLSLTGHSSKRVLLSTKLAVCNVTWDKQTRDDVRGNDSAGDAFKPRLLRSTIRRLKESEIRGSLTDYNDEWRRCRYESKPNQRKRCTKLLSHSRKKDASGSPVLQIQKSLLGSNNFMSRYTTRM